MADTTENTRDSVPPDAAKNAAGHRSFEAVRLETRRLILRPLRDDDAADLYAVFSDARVARYLNKSAWTEFDLSRQRIARDIRSLASGEYLCLGLESREIGKIIGECSLFNFFDQCRRAEIGYAMRFDSWGGGLMGEALTALLDFGFDHLNLNRVEADIDPRNRASALSLERLAFVKEGHLRQRWIVDGELSDSDLYGLLASDWKRRAAHR